MKDEAPKYQPIKARWCAELETETVMPGSVTVHTDRPEYEPTGLLDAYGRPPLRALPRMGFLK